MNTRTHEIGIVSWGVIGAGDVCERKSGPPLYRVAGSALRAIHRRDRVAGEDFVRRHGHGRYVADLDAMLEDPSLDAIYVASPHALHAEHAIRALEAGKHVLVEKPMALSVVDCDRMIEAARTAHRTLAVAYYRRGYPAVTKLKEIIETGEIGAVRSMSVNSEFPTSHRIDLVHFLVGDIARLKCEAKRDDGGYRFEQMMPRLYLQTAEGATVTMSEQWTETGLPETIRIEGASGTADVDDLKGGRIAITRDGEVKHIRVSSLPWTHWGLVENMVAHLLRGATLLCDGREGRKSTVILEYVNAAGARDDWVDIDYASMSS